MSFWNKVLNIFNHLDSLLGSDSNHIQRTGEEEFLDYNMVIAFDTFSKRSQNDDGRSMYFLGLIYEQGYGVVKADMQAARYFFQKGSEAGDILCNVHISLLNKKSILGIVNSTLKTMADMGDVFAMNELNNLSRSQGDKTEQWNIKAAETGYWKTMLELAQGYWESFEYELAFKYAEMAVNRGCTAAFKIMADCYLDGKGVQKDFNKGIQLLTELNMAEPGLDVVFQIANRLDKHGSVDKAMRWYKKLPYSLLEKVSHENAEDNLYAGVLHEKGIGTPQDSTTALHYYILAAEKGNIEAKYKAGSWLLNGRGTMIDKARGYPLIEQAAQAGHADAQCELGICYHRGTMVEKNIERSNAWIKKSADNGSSEGLYWLGCVYLRGYGVPVDSAKGEMLIKQAAEMGNARGIFYMALKPGNDDYLPLMKSAAEKGHGPAQYVLGETYSSESEIAFQYFMQAAQSGDVDGEYMVGFHYRHGIQVKKDITKAICWLNRSADKGRTDAMVQLGLIYCYGDGVEEDTVKAEMWWEKAAKIGNIEAQFLLCELYVIIGINGKFDKSKGFFWCEKSAQGGYGIAQHNMGYFYENGVCVEKNISKALFWYQKGAESGNLLSALGIGVLYFQEDEIKDIDKAEYILWEYEPKEKNEVELKLWTELKDNIYKVRGYDTLPSHEYFPDLNFSKLHYLLGKMNQ